MVSIKLLNLAKVQARIAKIPAAAADALRAQLKVEVDELVAAQKRAAPVGTEDEKHFRDSIRAYPNPDRAIGYRIIADARDDKGNLIGSHIEFGHRAPDGTHVAARPSFFPTFRARKKGMRRRINAAARKAVRAKFPKG